MGYSFCLNSDYTQKWKIFKKNGLNEYNIMMNMEACLAKSKTDRVWKLQLIEEKMNKEGINRIGVVHILLLQNLNWLNPSPLPSLRDEIKIGKCYNIV